MSRKKNPLPAIVLMLAITTTWMILSGLAGCDARAERPGRSVAPAITVLYDITVDNRAALVDGLERTILKLENRMIHEFESVKGMQIIFSKIDDRGENQADFTIQVPTEAGRNRKNLRKTLLQLSAQWVQLKVRIRTDKRRYRRSMYIEPILRSLKESSDLIIVGDLVLVDQFRNFGRDRYGDCPGLKSAAAGRSIEMLRIGVAGQNHKRINRIESWWQKCLLGEQKVQLALGDR